MARTIRNTIFCIGRKCEACIPCTQRRRLVAGFAGIMNRSGEDENCVDCQQWNERRFVLQPSPDDGCTWIATDDLPCNGTRLEFSLVQDFPGEGDLTIEIGIFENGNFMGDFRTVLAGVDQVDCSAIGGLQFWAPSVNDPDECDWSLGACSIAIDTCENIDE